MTLLGGLGAIFGSPADLSLIRMQADGTLPAAERRNYTGVAGPVPASPTDRPCRPRH